METKQKVLISVIVVGLIVIGYIAYMTYLGIKGDPEYKEQIQEDAQEYLNETYDETITVVDVLHDNMDIYQEFTYAAIAEIEGNDDFRILVFRDRETGEMIDSIVAETWEHELETFLNPILDDAFGDIVNEVWIVYQKDIGERLNISPDNIPSLGGQDDAHTVIRITLDRAKEDDDEEKLDDIIEMLKNDLNLARGNITITYNDNALLFKSKSIMKEI